VAVGHELLLEGARAKKRGPVELLPHRARRGEVHVEADEVDELQRPHPKAPEIAHGGVDLVCAGEAFLEDPQGLQVIGPGDVVDDEPRHVGGSGRDLAPAHGDPADAIDHRVVGLRARDDLHELHEGRRVEEVHPDGAMRLGDRLAQPAYGQ
jgi:hypothetical protein